MRKPLPIAALAVALVAVGAAALVLVGEEPARRAVAATELPPGTAIVATDMKLAPPGAAAVEPALDPDALVGRVLRRRRRPGEPVGEEDLMPRGTLPGIQSLCPPGKITVTYAASKIGLSRELNIEGISIGILSAPPRQSGGRRDARPGGQGPWGQCDDLDQGARTLVRDALILLSAIPEMPGPGGTMQGDVTLAITQEEFHQLEVALAKGHQLKSFSWNAPAESVRTIER